MKLPRDLKGTELAQELKSFGDQVTRQMRSHLRLTTQQNGEHHITDVAHHFNKTHEEIAMRLFGKG